MRDGVDVLDRAADVVPFHAGERLAWRLVRDA